MKGYLKKIIPFGVLLIVIIYFVVLYSEPSSKQVYKQNDFEDSFQTFIDYGDHLIHAIVVEVDADEFVDRIVVNSKSEGKIKAFFCYKDITLFSYEFAIIEGENVFVLPKITVDALRIDFVEGVNLEDLSSIQLSGNYISTDMLLFVWLIIIIALVILMFICKKSYLRALFIGCILILISMNVSSFTKEKELLPLSFDKFQYDIYDLESYSEGLCVEDDKFLKTKDVAWIDLCFPESYQNKILTYAGDVDLNVLAICVGNGEGFYETYENVKLNGDTLIPVNGIRSIVRVYLDGDIGTSYDIEEFIVKNDITRTLEMFKILVLYFVVFFVALFCKKNVESIKMFICSVYRWCKENGYLIAGGILFILYAYGCWKYSQPYMYADEMGYWSHAATMVGRDWSNVLQVTQMNWYSYGYSLILAILMFLLEETQLVYIGAVLVNAILIVIAYFKLIEILKRLIARANRNLLAVVSFVVMLYPSFYFQAKIAWSEILLYTVVICVFDVILKYFENPSLANLIKVSCALVIMYMIHNRTIAIIIAFSITLFFYKGKEEKKNILLFFAVFIVSVMIYNFGKDILVSKEFGEVSVTGNSIGSTLKRILSKDLLENIIWLIKTYLGQMWYLFVGTLSLFFWGIWFCIKQLIEKIKEKNVEAYFYAFLLLQFVGQSLISTLFMTNTIDFSTEIVRIDPVMYGRYNECFVAIFMALGLFYVIQTTLKKENVIVLIVMFLAFLGFQMIIEGVVEEAGRITINIAAVVSTYVCALIGPYIVFENFIYLILGILVVVCLVWAMKKYHEIYKYILILIFGIMFIRTGVVVSTSIEAVHFNKEISEERTIFNYVADNCEGNTINTTISNLFFLYDMQTWIYNKSVVYIDVEELEESAIDNYIVMDKDEIVLLEDDVNIIFSTENYAIIGKDKRQ